MIKFITNIISKLLTHQNNPHINKKAKQLLLDQINSYKNSLEIHIRYNCSQYAFTDADRIKTCLIFLNQIDPKLTKQIYDELTTIDGYAFMCVDGKINLSQP